MTHDRLLDLVVKVNVAFALISWPFVIYEALSKNVAPAELKSKLDLKRDQVFAVIILKIEDSLRPYWPRGGNRLVLPADPAYYAELTVLGDAARDALRNCIADCEGLNRRAFKIRGLAKRVSKWDKVTYWSSFATAILSAASLVIWFFDSDMTDRLARLLIAAPGAFAFFTLCAAAVRQVYLHRAHDAIIED